MWLAQRLFVDSMVRSLDEHDFTAILHTQLVSISHALGELACVLFGAPQIIPKQCRGESAAIRLMYFM